MKVYSATDVELGGAAGLAVTESRAEEYVLFVESFPEGAEVTVDGEPQGAAPASLNLACVPGEKVVVWLKLAGYQPARHLLICKAGSLVSVKAKLEPARRVR